MSVQESINRLNNLNHDNNDWGTIIDQLITAVQEIATDHATTKTAVDEGKALADELRTDHATTKTAVDELNTLTDELHDDHATFLTEQTAIGTSLADYKAIYDAHTHKLPATPIEDENTSAPDTTAATGGKAPGAASAFTDTSGSPPATITATKATAGPATITAAAATAGPATLSAATITSLT